MASENNRGFKKGNYTKSVIEEEQRERLDFFSDDDLGVDEREQPDFSHKKAPVAGSVREKMESLRKAAEERRAARESLPEREQPFDGKLKAKIGRRKGVLALGVSICIFALIGLGTVLYLIGAGIGAAVRNNPSLKKYDDIIAPVVFFDPAPFETLEDADAENIVYICLWETIKNNLEDYELAENGKTIVPVTDVDATAIRLFGSGAVLDYSMFEGNENDIDYIADQNTLEVFSTGIDGFTHKTLKIKRNGDQKEITVGYIEPDSGEEEGKTVYSKKMIYVVKKDAVTKKYYVAAVRDYAE